MDPINVQLFKSDSGLPDEWLIKWTNSTPGDTVRNEYYMAAYQNPATGVITLQYPYNDITYNRPFMAALLLDKDGGLLVNKEWYHLNTSTNQAVFLRSTVPGVILGGELFTAHGPTYPYLTGCEGNTGTGATGVVTLGNNALAYNLNGSHIVSCGGWAGPGTWPDDVAYVSALFGSTGNRLAAIHRDGTNGSYVGTSSFRADATLLWPDSNDLYLQSRSNTAGGGIEFVAGSCDTTTHLPQAVDNRLFYYISNAVTDRVVGYSYGVLTGTALFRVEPAGTYTQIAIASVADPWGTPSIRNSGNAYSFGYNTESVSFYGGVHCPDAYSSYQGLWITSVYSTSLGYQILAIDDYFVTDIASWQYKIGTTPVAWYIYPDPASDNHVIFSYSSGSTNYVMRLRASSVVAGLGFTTAGVTASAPTTAVLRYLGVPHNTSTPAGEYSAPLTVSHVTSTVGSIAMSAPSNLLYQGGKD
jgi:hypothetical protein